MSGFPASLFAGRRFAVVGLGRNGLPAAAALIAMGARVTGWDDRAEARAAAEAAGVPVADPTRHLDAEAMVLSPGIPHRLPHPHPAALAAGAAGIPILSDAELLFQAVRAAGSAARFVGVTGTNGKSTTTALIAHVLAAAGVPAAAGGNLGPAALALPLLPDAGCYVLEMSSYMLERIATLGFAVAIMLNLSPDHLDRHGGMEGYVAAKRAIFARQSARDVAVIGIDDAPSREMAGWLRAQHAQVRTVSGSRHADYWCEHGRLRDAEGAILDLATAPALPGAHNAQNAAATAAACLALGVARAAVARGIATYPGLPHRQQRIGSVGGVLFVNDSKATNADAAERALACYDRLVWIAGGIGKADGIRPLTPSRASRTRC
jgi:UDP-N-acetylmuramoylalanine--D-glutamate ligase